MNIKAGEFVGLIGPNGAGKTTLIKMLTGIIAPSSGMVSVLGYYPNKLENAFKKQYAVVMGQKSQLIYDLSASDIFLLYKEMYEIPDDVYKHNIEMFTELFDSKDYMNVQVRTLSLGERMKMELVTALLHNPKILFLDEPTIGLDAPAQRSIRTFLKEVNRKNGTTILLTSHYMEDVRSLCPRSIVIGNGKKVYDGDTEDLFSSYQTHKKITLSFENETDFILPDSLADIVSTNCTITEQSPLKAVLLVPKEESSILLDYVMRNFQLSDISIEEEDIGVIVEKIYNNTGTET